MEKRRKSKIKSYIALFLVLCMAGFLAVMPRLAGSGVDDDGPSILTAAAQKRDIDRILQGAGILECTGSEDAGVPNGVRVTELLVKNGDTVREGDPVAKVDRVSIMSAITQIQDALDEIDEELSDTKMKDSEDVTVRQDGTVKYIYAQPGDNVAEVMRQCGALAVLSLDDKMVVELPDGRALTAGQIVAVVLPDGTEQVGFVEERIGDAARVSLKDEDLDVGTVVTVKDGNGTEIGSGELQINSPWSVIALSGTVERVKYVPGEHISSGRTIMVLKDVGVSSQYEGLLIQRREYEAEMLKLFLLYQSGVLTAPRDGIVSGVNEAIVSPLRYSDGGVHLELLVNAPNGDDNTLYLNFALAVLSTEGETYGVMMNGTPLMITDYADLSSITLDQNAASTQMVLPKTVPIYARYGGSWRQISADAVHVGDLLVAAFDMTMQPVWAVLVAQENGEEPTDPTVPTDPADPSVPTDPTVPTNPTEPSDPTDPTVPSIPGDLPGNIPGFQIPSDYPQFGGFSGGSVQVPQAPSRYEIREENVLTVVSGTQMSLTVTFDERDIASVLPGMTAKVLLEALPDSVCTATVESVSHTGTNSGGSSKFTAKLALALEGDMLPGMNACAVFTLETVRDALTVPVAALVELNGTPAVYTAYDAQKNLLMNPVAVELGTSDGEYVQIISGLNAGSEIWYAYYDTLKITNTVDVNRFGY